MLSESLVLYRYHRGSEITEYKEVKTSSFNKIIASTFKRPREIYFTFLLYFRQLSPEGLCGSTCRCGRVGWVFKFLRGFGGKRSGTELR